MIRSGQRVTLDSVIERVNEVIENKIEFEHLIRPLGNILRVDRASFFANLMRQRHEERTCSGRWVIDFHSSQVGMIANEQTRHDSSNRVRRVVLGVLATRIGIVVFDKVFEDSGKKIEVFLERLFEREIDEFVDQRTGEISTFGGIGYKDREPLEDRNTCALGCLGRENIDVIMRNRFHRAVKERIKLTLGLVVPKIRYQVLGLQFGHIRVERIEQFFAFFGLQAGISFFPFVGMRDNHTKVGTSMFDGIAELIVEELIQEHLCDDLVLVAVITQSV